MTESGNQMTPRERIKATIHFEKPDVLPWCEIFDIEAILSWFSQGLRPDSDVVKFGFTWSGGDLLVAIKTFYGFNINGLFECVDIFHDCPVPVDLGPIPRFKERTLFEDNKYLDFLVWTGARARTRRDRMYSMPMFVEFPVRDRKSWEEYRKRLDPEDPRRYPKDWHKDAYVELFEHYQKANTVLCLNGFYSFGAQLMGIPSFNLMFYKDPELIERMVQHWEAFTIGTLKEAVETLKNRIDMVMWWEDMAERHGPNLSPRLCYEFLLPHYKKVTSFLKTNGIDRIVMDSDGNMNPMLDFLIDAGITGLWPLEVNSGMDARVIRKKYGNKLFLIGNLDKRALAKGGESMRGEVDSKVPVLKEEGGYIPGADHTIHVEFTFDKFKEYASHIRSIL